MTDFSKSNKPTRICDCGNHMPAKYDLCVNCQHVENLIVEEDRLKRVIAMNNLLNSPKGVVPKSAERFYDLKNGVFK